MNQIKPEKMKNQKMGCCGCFAFTGLAIFVLLVIGFIIIPSDNSANNTGKSPSNELSHDKHDHQPIEPVRAVFDIPALAHKNIDEIREIFGPPRNENPTPTEAARKVWAYKEKVGRPDPVQSWSNQFIKDEESLVVFYDVRSRKVIEFFLEGNKDKATLMRLGNLTEANSEYRIALHRSVVDRSKVTGITIQPPRFSYIEAARIKREEEAKRRAAIEAAKWRTWTTADGKYKVEAKFVKCGAGMLTLEKKDGSTVDVPLGRLCLDDQEFVKQQKWLVPQKEN